MKRLHLILFLAISAGLLAWSREFRMTNNPQDPAAVGKVNIEHDRNGNNGISLHVYHLADPEKLSPPRSVYVV